MSSPKQEELTLAKAHHATGRPAVAGSTPRKDGEEKETGLGANKGDLDPVDPACLDVAVQLQDEYALVLCRILLCALGVLARGNP